MRYKSVMLLVTFATFVRTVWLYIIIPKGFFPTEDTGFISASTEGATDISFAAMVELQRQVAEIVRKDPAVDYVNSTVGAGGPNPTQNIGRMFIALKPQEGARRNSTEVIQRLRRTAKSFPAWRSIFQNVQNINITGRISKSEYQYTLQSSDTEALYRHRARDCATGSPRSTGLRDVTTDLYIKNPQMTVEIDREKAAVYGITDRPDPAGAVQRLRRAAGGDDLHADQRLSGHSRKQPEFQADPSQLQNIFVKTNVAGGAGEPDRRRRQRQRRALGPSIPLSAVTRVVPSVGPLQVNHQGQQPAVTISFNLRRAFRSAQAVDAISEIERESGLPATIITGFQGAAQVFQELAQGPGLLILAAIFVVYVVLGMLYESFIHPITIISGLPSAGIGALLTLMLFSMDLSVIAMIGIVMLVGIVKKNAIMMIDFAIERRRVGLSRRGRDPRGLPAALPADHDDDVRRDLRHAADRARHRRGRRAAPAARHRRGRRAAAVAAPDALHHAGRLHLPRPHRPHAQVPARAAAARRCRSIPSGRPR